MKYWARQFLIILLRGYKWLISPLFPPSCRYVPTCSEYAVEAVERFGVVRGTLMAGWRVLRCHPFVQGGYDPVVKNASGVPNQGFETCPKEGPFAAHRAKAS